MSFIPIMNALPCYINCAVGRPLNYCNRASEIQLPDLAPREYADRQALWNAVEKAERGKNAQLAYSFNIALQNEFSMEENIALARHFLLEHFVSRDMVVDFDIHVPDIEPSGISNSHFHVMAPIRPIEENGKWGCKQHRVIRWKKMEISFWMRTATTFSTRFPQPTGDLRKRGNTVGHSGLLCAVPSLKKGKADVI